VRRGRTRTIGQKVSGLPPPVGRQGSGMDPLVKPEGDEDGKISARYGRADRCQWSPKGADEACQRHRKNGSEDRAA